jgi:hypothetical protein
MTTAAGPLGPTGPSDDELRAARLQVEVDGAVVTVVLDLPERRNSQTPRTWHALAAIGRALLLGGHRHPAAAARWAGGRGVRR